MMRTLLAKGLLCLAFTCFVMTSSAQTIKIWPGQGVGNGITYGADVKLTIFQIIRDGDINAVNNKFKKNLKMDLVRVPFIAHWGVGDNRYDEIRDYMINAESKGMKLFLSVANTDGTLNNSNLLRGAEREEKFAGWLKNGTGVYNININRYKNYVEDVIDELEKTSGGSNATVDYIGLWNEDNAKEGDYPNLSKPIVGYEPYALQDGINRYGSTSSSFPAYDGIKNKIAVAGSHDYSNTYPSAVNDWKTFASKGNKPEWFTETTKFAKSTAEGIAHMLPAISAGLEKMIIYQAVPRIVTKSGGNGTHYNATKRLIDHSQGKGSARRIEYVGNNKNGITAAFRNSNAVYNALEIHLSNVASGQKTYYINLQQGYKISNVFQQKYGGNVSTQIKNNGAQIQITIAGKTYVHLTCTGLSTARLANDIEQDEEFVEFATRLYPNPSNSGVFMLLLPDYDGFEGNVKLDLIDLQGKQVDSQELPYSSSLKLNYNIFPRGLYMLRVQVNGVQVTRRVTIGS